MPEGKLKQSVTNQTKQRRRSCKGGIHFADAAYLMLYANSLKLCSHASAIS